MDSSNAFVWVEADTLIKNAGRRTISALFVSSIDLNNTCFLNKGLTHSANLQMRTCWCGPAKSLWNYSPGLFWRSISWPTGWQLHEPLCRFSFTGPVRISQEGGRCWWLCNFYCNSYPELQIWMSRSTSILPGFPHCPTRAPITMGSDQGRRMTRQGQQSKGVQQTTFLEDVTHKKLHFCNRWNPPSYKEIYRHDQTKAVKQYGYFESSLHTKIRHLQSIYVD